MVSKGSIHVLDQGRILAEYGPMSLIIFAAIGKVPQIMEAQKAARISFLYLERIARVRERLNKSLINGLEKTGEPLADAMVEAVLKVQDPDLTPMAAVAGTIAEAVASYLYEKGMTRVIVSNGGDVAISLRKGESITIGIKDSVESKNVSGRIELDSSSSTWGIATSGLGGRSLTRGVASAVTVIAKEASVADAAATSIANNSFIPDKVVYQRRAKELDPQIDIPDAMVTVEVGPLPEEKKDVGIKKALKRAEQLVDLRLIHGAFVSIQGRCGMTKFFQSKWKPKDAG